tara:strand:- start:46 stop:249 length:204 start_codon:yes stop_codon:yes gene_type:complete
MSETLYEFYQQAKFSDGKAMMKTIQGTDKSFHLIKSRIEKCDKDEIPWKLFKNGQLIKKSSKTSESL